MIENGWFLLAILFHILGSPAGGSCPTSLVLPRDPSVGCLLVRRERTSPDSLRIVMSRKKIKHCGVCVFCGRRRLLTKDHVPPKCLFGEKGKRPSDLVTVPACKNCNMKASGDDEYLRLVLAGTVEASRHPVAGSLMPAITRSLGRPEAIGFAKMFVQNVSIVRTFTSSGLYVGKMPALSVDHMRLARIIEKIIRGLFFEEYGKRLPTSHGERFGLWGSRGELTIGRKGFVFKDLPKPGLVIGSQQNHVFRVVLRPKYARSFHSQVEDSTYRALDDAAADRQLPLASQAVVQAARGCIP